MGIFKTKTAVPFVQFMGAAVDYDDDGRAVDYAPRGPIVVNVQQICAAYDHTIIVTGHNIKVMETLDEIKAKLGM